MHNLPVYISITFIVTSLLAVGIFYSATRRSKISLYQLNIKFRHDFCHVLSMAIRQEISVAETAEHLKKLIDKGTPSTKPRLKMLLAIVDGITSTNDLAHKTKSNRDSIRNWKNTYRIKGLEGLLEDGRGGNRPGALNNQQKMALKEKLSNPKGGFTSYKQATEWINTTFAVEMNYHAVNMYLKRNFRTKLKVGRKTHVNKDENATALFKKLVTEAKTH